MMDNHKHENGDKDVDGPRAPPVSPKHTGGITQHSNTASQVGGRMKPTAETVSEVARKPKPKATTISLGGSRTDSSSLPSTERVPAMNVSGNITSEPTTVTSGCENVVIGAQSVLGPGLSRKSKAKTKQDSAPGRLALNSQGAEKGIVSISPPVSAARAYRHRGLHRKDKMDTTGSGYGASSTTTSASHRSNTGIASASPPRNAIGAYKHRGLNRKNKADTGTVSSTMSAGDCSTSVRVHSRVTTGRGLDARPRSILSSRNTTNEIYCDELEDSIHLARTEPGNGKERRLAPTPGLFHTEASPDITNIDLAVAQAIEDDDVADLLEAQEVNPEVLQKQETDKQKRRECRMVGCVIIVICSIVLGLSLGLSLGRKEMIPFASQPTKALIPDPTPSPTRPMPPMDYMELLYYSLPKKTKESLYDDSSSNSPQRQAWEWLRNHPRLSTYPEWRKKQIFAMATVFYSFEGPNWPETTNGYGRWMNYDMEDECSWVLSKEEIDFVYQESTSILGGGSQSYHDFHPCNEHGELQTIIVIRLILPPDMRNRVSIPPEIELLTSLTIFAIVFSQINVQLSDLFSVPEFVNMPNLESINLYKSGVSGSIPPEVFRMTNLRHILFGGDNNMLENTIPTEIARMSSLEYFNVFDVKGTMAGKLPSELGLMTTLTGLEVSWSAFSGTIPTQMGALTNMRKLALSRNRFSGPIGCAHLSSDTKRNLTFQLCQH